MAAFCNTLLVCGKSTTKVDWMLLKFFTVVKNFILDYYASLLKNNSYKNFLSFFLYKLSLTSIIYGCHNIVRDNVSYMTKAKIVIDGHLDNPKNIVNKGQIRETIISICAWKNCHKIYNEPIDLHKHLRTKHLTAKRLNNTHQKQCYWGKCRQKFKTLNNLKIHVRSHTGERPFPCNWKNCKKRVNTLTQLKTHMVTHTGERRYACKWEDCKKIFTTSGNLKTHIRSHTRDKPFACTICQKKFTTKHILKVHVRIHTGEKPHLCTTCGNTFRQPAALYNHIKSIHKEKQLHQPKICGKKFRESNQLKNLKPTDQSKVDSKVYMVHRFWRSWE